MIPALVFVASSLRRNPFIGCCTIELYAEDAFSKLISELHVMARNEAICFCNRKKLDINNSDCFAKLRKARNDESAKCKKNYFVLRYEPPQLAFQSIIFSMVLKYGKMAIPKSLFINYPFSIEPFLAV